MLTGFDCGVFVCMYADLMSSDYPLFLTEEDMNACRERIVAAILTNLAESFE